ncbi:hypothetical protein D3C81_1610580 [compost metagenome]
MDVICWRLTGRYLIACTAKPDPDDLVALLNVERRHFGLGRNLGLARHFYALAFAVKQQSVVTAADALSLQGAMGKGECAVTAAIFQGRGLTI